MAKRRLYRVEWSGECFVLANSERDAEKEALTGLRVLGSDDAGIEVSAAVVGSGAAQGAIPPEWSNARPFGARSGENDSVGQIARRQEGGSR